VAAWGDNLVHGFIAEHGATWEQNPYNDDIMWAVIALTRGPIFLGLQQRGGDPAGGSPDRPRHPGLKMRPGFRPRQAKGSS
jgi:hypothetical protein